MVDYVLFSLMILLYLTVKSLEAVSCCNFLPYRKALKLISFYSPQIKLGAEHAQEFCVFMSSYCPESYSNYFVFFSYVSRWICIFGVMHICINLSSQKLQCPCRTLENPLQPSDEKP